MRNPFQEDVDVYEIVNFEGEKELLIRWQRMLEALISKLIGVCNIRL